MSCFAGPEINESGLVLYLDAGNSKGFDDDENLYTYSEQFNDASWFKNNYNVTANATSAPDGTLTADKLIAINASTFHDLFKSPGLSSNTYTLSIFAKAAEQSFIQLRIDDGVLSRVAMFNLSTGSVSSSSNVTSPTITSYPNGWYRCSITVTTNIINVVFNGFPTSSNATYSGDGVSGVFIWGAQFEYGSSASTYYPTTGTAKIRGTTLIDLTGRGNTGTLTNGPTYSSSNGGALVFDGVDDRIECGTFSVPFLTVSTWVYKTTSTNEQGICRKEQGWAVSNYQGVLQVAPGTSWQFYNTGYTIPLNTWVNIVYTYSGTGAAGSQTVYINGVSIYSTSAGSGAISANGNQVNIGFDDNGWYWNGRIANTQIYNRALTAAEISQNFSAQSSRFLTL